MQCILKTTFLILPGIILRSMITYDYISLKGDKYWIKISTIDSFIQFRELKRVLWKMFFKSTTSQICPANVLSVAYKSESEYKVEG